MNPRVCTSCGMQGATGQGSGYLTKAGRVRPLKCPNGHEWKTLESVYEGVKRSSRPRAKYLEALRGVAVPPDKEAEWQALVRKGMSSKMVASIMGLPWVPPTKRRRYKRRTKHA